MGLLGNKQIMSKIMYRTYVQRAAKLTICWTDFGLIISPWWECVRAGWAVHIPLPTIFWRRVWYWDKISQRHSTQAIVNINEALMKHFWSELKTFYLTMTPDRERTLIRSPSTKGIFNETNALNLPVMCGHLFPQVCTQPQSFYSKLSIFHLIKFLKG